MSESTIANIYHRNTTPSISTLEAIFKNGFGITLSQFFADDEMVELTPQLRGFMEKRKEGRYYSQQKMHQWQNMTVSIHSSFFILHA